MYTYIIQTVERKELPALIDMCDCSVFDLYTPWVALDSWEKDFGKFSHKPLSFTVFARVSFPLSVYLSV